MYCLEPRFRDSCCINSTSAKGFAIQIYTEDFKNDYISLTDIAKYKNKEEPNVVVANWMIKFNNI